MADERVVDTPTDVGPLTFDDDTSTEPNKAEATSEPGVEIPEKFDGKSVEDVIRSYSELEKVHGRQSQELGELRRMADNLLLEKSRQTVTEVNAPDADKTVDLYEDPDAFVAARVKEAVQPLEQRLVESDKQNMQQRLHEAHPDFREVAVDPDFLDWVNLDTYRRRQYMEANNHDLDAAVNLFDTYKVTQTNRVEKEKQVKEEQLKAASMTTGSTGQTSQKIYNRAALVDLQIRDPAKYDALQPEIIKAYAEGRVR